MRKIKAVLKFELIRYSFISDIRAVLESRVIKQDIEESCEYAGVNDKPQD